MCACLKKKKLPFHLFLNSILLFLLLTCKCNMYGIQYRDTFLSFLTCLISPLWGYNVIWMNMVDIHYKSVLSIGLSFLKTTILYDHSTTISDKMQKNSGFSNANCCTYLHFRHLFEDLWRWIYDWSCLILFIKKISWTRICHINHVVM